MQLEEGWGSRGSLAAAFVTKPDAPSPPLWGRVGEGGAGRSIHRSLDDGPKNLLRKALLRTATPL
jgi:hypothetical protein